MTLCAAAAPQARSSTQRTSAQLPSLAELFREGGGVVERLKRREIVAALVREIRAASPALAAVLLDERDDYMAQGLAQLQGRAVAVVGLAHMEGLESRWRALQLGSREGDH